MRILIKEKLSEHKSKTPEGYLICQDAILARTGEQDYLMSEIYEDFDGEDKLIRVKRKPEQVFSAEALASFEDKPITVEHPDENVGPDNYSEYAVGHTRNIRKGKFNGQDVMIGDLVITDAQTIEDIENGIRSELSCGYDCDITKGDNPEQINIRGNHIALCEEGRAGIAKIIDSKAKVNDVNPRKGENKKDFLARFMKETEKEYPDRKQRFAVANSYWEKRAMKDTKLAMLPTAEKRKLSNYLSAVSKFMDHDININEVIDPIKTMGYEPIREKIDGWYDVDGAHRKDYYFSLDGYSDMFMVSFYATDDWKVNEVNAYFIGRKQPVEDAMRHTKFNNAVKMDDATNWQSLSENEVAEKIVSLLKKNDNAFDYYEFEIARMDDVSLDQYKLSHSVYDRASALMEEGFVDKQTFEFDDSMNDAGDNKSANKNDIQSVEDSDIEDVRIEDNEKYIIYADDTMTEDNKALFYIGNGKAQYMYSGDAPEFSKDEAEKLENQNGKYKWIKVKFVAPAIKDSSNKYVVYKKNDSYYGTPINNYNAKIQNARLITDLSNFNSAEEIIEYLIQYTNLNREDIVIVGEDPIVEKAKISDTDYSKHFYEEGKKAIENQIKKVKRESEDSLGEDAFKKEFNHQRRRLYEALKDELESYEKSLNEKTEVEDSNDKDPGIKIKEWYRETYPTDDLGKEIKDGVTFMNLFETLDAKEDVYKTLNVNDSVVRERCFKKLAEIMNTDYEYVYNQWLKANK